MSFIVFIETFTLHVEIRIGVETQMYEILTLDCLVHVYCYCLLEFCIGLHVSVFAGQMCFSNHFVTFMDTPV